MRRVRKIGLAACLFTPAAATAQWSVGVGTDRMSGEAFAYAYSPRVSPTTPMSFPYADTESNMAFSCNGDSESAYVSFTSEPNIANATIGDGYSTFESRIRWDDELLRVKFLQSWGSETIGFLDSSSAIERMQASESVLLELSWYGEGPTLFLYSLEGAAAAIHQDRETCALPSGSFGNISVDDLGSTTATRECELPTEIIVPRADEATLDEMLNAQSLVRDYVATMERYMSCVHVASHEYADAERQLTQVVTEFNEQVRLIREQLFD